MVLATQTSPVTTSTPASDQEAMIHAREEETLAKNVEKQRKNQQFEHYVAQGMYYWNRVLTVTLTLYATKGVYDMTRFLLVTYPELNEKQSLGLVTKHEVNNLSVDAALLLITTVLFVFLAWRLHNVRRETGPTLDLIVSMAFIVLSPLLQSYISMIDFVSLVGTIF